jgi:hypothetical protein
LPFLSLAALAVPGSARAEGPPGAVATTPHPHAYAVVIGSDVGGAGQAPLRFAEDDARRVADVFRELGHYPPDEIHVLLHPDAARLLAALDDVASKVRANAARAEQSEVLFYYSGHARANALTLGAEEIALTALRERLSGLPSTLTIVVLDACQSGAFTRVKGAEPAADFTYNSVARLTQKGLAVMASSSSEELSQESDELRGSFFTSNLVTALRGAGDTDGDGRVSLDEAYRYAYRRTLASTARTQVGEQHVTLETDLEGQDDVPVTYPAEAKAQLELPAALDAKVLVQHRPSGAVVAEVQKAPGTALRLAFVAGAYDAVVRRPGSILQCNFALADDRVTALDTAACTPVAADHTTSKGEGEREIRESDRWDLEAGAGFIFRRTDAYTQTLQNFGYQRQGGLVDLPSGRFTLGAARVLAPHIAGLIRVSTLAGDTYVRDLGGGGGTDTASFSAYAGGIFVRAYADVLGRWLGVYGQAGGGMSIGVLDYRTQQTGAPPSSTETHFGYLLSGAAGMTASLPRWVTFFVEAGYDWAPALTNLIGDTHDSGGPSLVLGLRLRLGDQP